MVFKKPMRFVASIAAMFTLFWTGLAQAEYELNLQDPVTPTAHAIYDLHMEIFYICVVIFVVVFGFMFYSIFAHRKSKNYKPAKFSHSTTVEIVWTIIPFFILAYMAYPATIVLLDMEDTTKSDLTIKITGYQWKWEYEYLDSGINFYSTLSTPREQIDQYANDEKVELGENYLLEVDNHMVIPSGKKVRLLVTANDVIHAWWIPAFGAKKDAIPGYINEMWVKVDPGKEGRYRGQCAELCGKDHAFMPIVVDVVTPEEFDAWVAAGGKQVDGAEEQVAENVEQATAEQTVAVAEQAAEETAEDKVSTEQADALKKTWTKEELMAQGEKVYKQCVSCHGAEGQGLPGVFPAIAGSSIATGDINAHIDIVMNGKSGTAMAGYASQLSDAEIASVITYQRNSFGNNTGDVALPADIKVNR